MKLKTLSYSESRETVNAAGLKQWVKIGVEMEIEDGEDYPANRINIFQAAKDQVQQWHKESNPSSYFQSTELPVIQEKDR